MRAKASTRGDKVTLSVGILSMEVTMFTSVESGWGIQRKMFHPVNGEDDHEVGYSPYDKVTGQILTMADTVKKVATEYGFVPVSEAEEERLFNLTPKTMAVRSVHPMIAWRAGTLTSKRTWTIEASPMTVGKRKVPHKTNQIALRALLDVLAERDAFAFADLVTRGKPKPVVILPHGEVHELYFAEELRERRPEVELAENDLAKAGQFHPIISQMLDSLWRDSVEEPSDARTILIQQFADEKAHAGDFTSTVDLVPVAETSVPDDTDALLAALQASVLKRAS